MAGWLRDSSIYSAECNDRQATAYMAVFVTPDRAWTFCCSLQQSSSALPGALLHRGPLPLPSDL